MLTAYRQHVKERARQGMPPLPLDARQVTELTRLLVCPPKGEEQLLIDLLAHRIAPGDLFSAQLKTAFLSAIVHDEQQSPLISPIVAIKLLGSMKTASSATALITCLESDYAQEAASQLKQHACLTATDFQAVVIRARQGHHYAQQILLAWASGDEFMLGLPIATSLTLTVFKASGAISSLDRVTAEPHNSATAPPDIPLQALKMLTESHPATAPDQPGASGPSAQLEQLKAAGHPLAYVSHRINSDTQYAIVSQVLAWHLGRDVAMVPNQRFGGVCLASHLPRHVSNALLEAGILPIEMDISPLITGELITLHPYEGVVVDDQSNLPVQTFTPPHYALKAINAGGRRTLVHKRLLMRSARKALENIHE